MGLMELLILWPKGLWRKIFNLLASRASIFGIDIPLTEELKLLLQDNATHQEYIKIAYVPELTGNILRASGINNFVTRGFSADDTPNDLTQTTAINQPYLSKIAPVEKGALLNPQGGQTFLTHPTITFLTNNSWTAEFVLNWSGKGNNDNVEFAGFASALGIKLRDIGINRLSVISGVGSISTISSYLTSHLIGKSSILHFVAEGEAFKFYVNNVLVHTSAAATNRTAGSIDRIIYGRNGAPTALDGKIHSYHLFSKALTQSEITTRATLLRSIFPEVESVAIGSQTWAVRNYEAVSTPLGTIIPEVTGSVAVEKIVNGGFDTDTVWAKGAGITIFGGTANALNVVENTSLQQNINAVQGRAYKVTFTILNFTSGSISVRFPFVSHQWFTGNGTFTAYGIADQSNINFQFQFKGINSTFSIDNASVQEMNWANSQELYDGIYAQTAGTAAQKELAAVKAAAMWSHYNNDAANGAVYGKLYNWFAVKLLQLDIDAYNLANPSTPWGWKVPAQADFTTLETTLGGGAVAGGKLKMAGLSYWNAPNTGATNESGFTALAGGMRIETTGSFNVLNTECEFKTIDSGEHFLLTSTSSAVVFRNRSNMRGHALRLIKA